MGKPFKTSAVALALALASFAARAAFGLPSFTFYGNEAAFAGATANPAFESFEGLSASTRSGNPVVRAGLTVTPLGPALLGVQTAALTPEDGHGAVATHGSTYLLSYLAGLPTGSVQFDFNTPIKAFGLNLIDVGEAAGTVIVKTNAGALTNPLTAYTFTDLTLRPNGNVLFLGFSQATAFSRVTLQVTGVDDSYGLDKVYVQSVPEPGQWALLLAGALSVFALARRRIRV